eukprot:2764278-Rhodomonas_salina.3
MVGTRRIVEEHGGDEEVSRTAIVYAAMRFVQMLLCAVWYCHSVCCYALSGTELAYAAMRCVVWCYVLCGTEIACDARS